MLNRILLAWIMAVVSYSFVAPDVNAAPNPTCGWKWVRVSGSGEEVWGNFNLSPRGSARRAWNCTTQGQPSETGPTPTSPTPSRADQLATCIATGRAKAPKEDWGLIGFLCASIHPPNRRVATRPVDLKALAARLATHLRLPDTTPRIGPNPANNEWNMLAVGYPIWLWVDSPATASTRATTGGFTFNLTARRTLTTFTMGDGHTVTCTSTTRHTTNVTPGTPSPTCGYTYTRPSSPGRYTITASAHWTIDWSVDGMSGSFPHTYSAATTLRVGELQALVR